MVSRAEQSSWVNRPSAEQCRLRVQIGGGVQRSRAKLQSKQEKGEALAPPSEAMSAPTFLHPQRVTGMAIPGTRV
ncbi:hypothetical protein U1Q18_006543 [Sarracenia purpurea var. burkii]